MRWLLDIENEARNDLRNGKRGRDAGELPAVEENDDRHDVSGGDDAGNAHGFPIATARLQAAVEQPGDPVWNETERVDRQKGCGHGRVVTRESTVLESQLDDKPAIDYQNQGRRHQKQDEAPDRSNERYAKSGRVVRDICLAHRDESQDASGRGNDEQRAHHQLSGIGQVGYLPGWKGGSQPPLDDDHVLKQGRKQEHRDGSPGDRYSRRNPGTAVASRRKAANRPDLKREVEHAAGQHSPRRSECPERSGEPDSRGRSRKIHQSHAERRREETLPNIQLGSEDGAEAHGDHAAGGYAQQGGGIRYLGMSPAMGKQSNGGYRFEPDGGERGTEDRGASAKHNDQEPARRYAGVHVSCQDGQEGGYDGFVDQDGTHERRQKDAHEVGVGTGAGPEYCRDNRVASERRQVGEAEREHEERQITPFVGCWNGGIRNRREIG